MSKPHFFDFFKNDKKSFGAILIDVASGSLGAALVVFREQEIPRIVFEVREQFPIQSKLSRHTLLLVMLETFDKVTKIVAEQGIPIFLKKEKGVKFEKIIVQFSSPWHISTTKSLNFNFEKPFVITSNFIKDILQHESKSFVSSINKDGIENSFDSQQKYLVAEQEIFSILLNGYPIDFPIGRQAKELEMSLFLSAFPIGIIKRVQKLSDKYFSGIEPDFHSSVAVYFDVLKGLFPKESSFMIIHISGETTDVSIVKNEAVTESVSFPLGRNFIVRKLVNEIRGITPTVALSMIKTNAEGDTLPKLSTKLESILSQAESDWIELFVDSIHDFSKNFFLPVKVFIIAGDDMAPTFADLISKRKLAIHGSVMPTISAEAIGMSLFDKFVENRQGDRHDIFLSALAFFSQKLYFNN